MALLDAPVREDPPKRTGRGRGVPDELVELMRAVGASPNEWWKIAEYGTRGSASSAANRMRRRDWNGLVGYPTGTWEIVSRTNGDGEAGVWVRRVTNRRR